MRKVYLLEHVAVKGRPCEDIKRIGIYSSYKLALEAYYRLKDKPGFRIAQNLVNPSVDDNEEGFYIDAYEINQDNWEGGFVDEDWEE